MSARPLTLSLVRHPRALRAALGGSDRMRAGALAAATLVTNGIALLLTIVFARLLGPDGYGSYAALVSSFLILGVPGLALQVATAREVAVGRYGTGGVLAATLAGWMLRLAVAALAALALSILLREQIARAVGVDEAWAAAAIIPTGLLWVALSVQRGALQGVGALGAVGASLVGEALGRFAAGVALSAGGAGVTGAYLGTPVAIAVTSGALGLVLRRRLGRARPLAVRARLRTLTLGAWAPVAALTLVALLQNVDVIVVRHRFEGDEAGAYAAAAVAAKALIWVAAGVSLYLVPEAARRAAAGERPRAVLRLALTIVAGLALPALAIFAAVPSPLLELAFGARFTGAHGSLIVLGVAMTLLACCYLGVQYLLALHRSAFLWVLGIVAATEPVVLTFGSGYAGIAAIVLAAQAVAAAGVLALAVRAHGKGPV